MDALNIGHVDLPAFRRILLLLKVQFDAGQILAEYSPNREAYELLECLCAEYGVK